MKQAFTSSSFAWLGASSDAGKEAVGSHVENWGAGLSIFSLQNFLLAGVGSAREEASTSALLSLRKHINPLAWPLDGSQVLYDCGDLLDCADSELRDTIVAKLIDNAVRGNVFPIVMNTTVQAGYGVYAGACLSSMESSTALFPGYIRLSPKLLTSSSDVPNRSIGSSMAGLSQRFNKPLNVLQLAVQEAINRKSAWDAAASLGIQALTLAACESELLLLYMRNFCKDVDEVVLSLDLDVLSEAYAPGAHRATSFGLSTEVLLPAIRWLAGEGKLVAVELTGVGLERQGDDQRARLAASITQDLLSHWF